MTKTAAKRKPIPRSNVLTIQRFNALSVEICILAGGLSKRMGRDKSHLRLGSTTMLGHIRKTARATGLPVRLIRRDCVPKCGPLGGIYTALKTTKADAVLFLACDMPFVSAELIEFMLRKWGANPVAAPSGGRALPRTAGTLFPLFARSHGLAGFPFILPCEAIETVSRQIQQGDLSLQTLAKELRATILHLKRPWSRQVFNVNTPQEWANIKKRFLRLRRSQRVAD